MASDGDPPLPPAPDPAALAESLREGTRSVAIGRFRVDAAGAAARAKHLLASHDEWLLPLLSAAVLGGSTTFDVRAGWRGLTIGFDGIAPSPEQLEAIGTGVPTGASAEERTLRELALALHVARATEPAWLHFDSPVGARLSFEGDRVRVTSAPPGRMARVALPHARRLDALRAAAGGAPPAMRILRERGLFAPPRICVTANGRRVNAPIDLGVCAACVVLTGAGPEPAFEVVPPRAFLTRRHDASFSAVVGLSSDWYDRRYLSPMGAAAAFVRDGVCVLVEQLDLGCDNLRAVICAPGVHFDASRAQVVRDEAFERVVSEVREQVRACLEELSERWEPEHGEGPRWFYTQALEGLERRARRQARLGVACRIRGTLERAFDAKLRRRDAYAGDATRHHAAVLARAGRTAAARERMERLLRLRRGRWRSVSEAEAAADLAALELDAGNPEAAGELARRAERRARYDRKLESPNRVLEYLELRAEARVRNGEDARRLVKRAVRVIEKSRHRSSGTCAAAARFFLAAGMTHEALEWSERALEDAQRHAERSEAELRLLAATTHAARGEWDACRNQAEAARDSGRRELGEAHPEISGACVLLALASEAAGEPKEADRWLDEAVSIRAHCFAAGHPALAELDELRRVLDAARRGAEQPLAPPGLTISYGEFWTAYEPSPCRHRPVVLRRRRED